MQQTSSAARAQARRAPRIEDHGLIGDMRTAALVTRDGALDWLCLPAFDSDACFASLLGTEKNGHWTIAPTLPIRETRRRYRKDTLILETEMVTDQGTLLIVDFMPPRAGERRSIVCRIARCLEGKIPVRSELAPRFAFGHAIPRVTQVGSATMMYAGPDALYLRGGPPNGAPALACDVVMSVNDEIAWSLAYGVSYDDAPPAENVRDLERLTEERWRGWVSKLRVPALERDMIVRSLLTIKACIYEPSGGIVAAPTTSLPETPGGIRNWDYRYTWLRDGALSIRSLILAGQVDEARALFAWMERAIAGDPGQIQIMYGLRGERRLSEVELDWMDGYEGAKPVRVGNGAYEQRQLDIYGEIAGVFYEGSLRVDRLRPNVERSLLSMARYVSTHWREPDRGIWEMRGPERSFTASKVSAWTALDRAIRYVDEHALGDDVTDLRRAKQEIFDEVCREGWNAQKNTFTQYYGGTGLDASLLFLPLSGFLPPNDPRVVGTVAALERELMPDGFLLRFKPEGDVDGLEGDEGAFLACSYWLVTTYAMMGRTDDARELFARVNATANDLGLFAEEWEPKLKRQLGNFPQLFTHFAFVTSAYVLGEGAKVTPSPIAPR